MNLAMEHAATFVRNAQKIKKPVRNIEVIHVATEDKFVTFPAYDKANGNDAVHLYYKPF